MPTKKQKELGLDTFEIEASKGHVRMFMDFLEVKAEVKKKSLRAVFEELVVELHYKDYDEELRTAIFKAHLNHD